MRLIDADAFLKEYCEPYPHIYKAMSSAFKHAPTVDAIPIEWIKKYTEENRLYQSDDFDLYIHDMIADWAERKEE